MRIVQIVGSVDPHIGGKERFVGELARELSGLGHDVTLITCDRTSQMDIGCDVGCIRSSSLPGFPEIPSPSDLIKHLNSTFDICHLHYHALFGEIVGLVCKKLDHTLITTFHDEMKRGAHKVMYDRLLLHAVSHLSHRIICLTDGMKRALVRRGVDGRKVAVIPNAMHVKELQTQARRIENSEDHDVDFDLLFVGRLEKRKGVQCLLKALWMLKKENFEPTLKIIGRGDYKGKLMSTVKRNRLSSQVTFSGYISRKELLTSYNHTRCVVIPSLYEGIPAVAIEALALGKPVITTSIPGMEAISSRRLGFTTPPGDYNVLAEAIRKILSMKDEELQRIKSAGKAFAEQYDWSRTIEQIIHVYYECYKNGCEQKGIDRSVR